MRAGLVVFSPIISLIGNDLGLSTIQLAWLTSIPVLCFALASPATTWLRRIGSVNQIITWALWLLGISLIARTLHGAIVFYLFTVGVGVSIAALNVLLPIWVKRTSQKDSGALTGMYVAMMSLATSIALAAAPWLAKQTSLGWRLALAPWGLIALISAIWWQRHIRGDEPEPKVTKADVEFKKFLHSPLAWQIMMIFGLQSMNAFAARTWVPTIMIDKGSSMQTAGTTIAIAGLVGALLSLYVPHAAQRHADQRIIIWILALIGCGSFVGLEFGNTTVVMICAGISNVMQWLYYPVVLLLIILRTENSNHAQSLSAMVQTFGYLMGAVAPILTGWLFENTGSWSISIWFMAANAFLIGVFGHFAGRVGYVRQREVVIDSAL